MGRPRSVYRELSYHNPQLDEACQHPVHLTQRQCEVLALVARGLTDKQIGVELALSVCTVQVHVANMREITGATSRTALVVLALFGHMPDRIDMEKFVKEGVLEHG